MNTNNMFWETDENKLIMSQIFSNKNQKEIKKKLLEQFVEIKGKKPTYILKGEVFDSFVNAKTNKLPCGYSWVTLDGVLNCPDDELINAKCGQAATGNVIGRVRSYGGETRSAQLIVSIIINDAFDKENKAFDQVLNKSLEQDWYKEYKIKINSDRRTNEDVLVNRNILFTDFHELKKESLNNLIGDDTVVDTFRGNESQLRCLRKLKKWKGSIQQMFLLDCVMRFGKTFMFYEYIKENYVNKDIFEIHAVFCHDTKTRDGWIKKADKYYKGLFNVIQLNDVRNFDFNQAVDKNTIVLISQQLLHANKLDVSDITEKYEKTLQELIKFDIKVENVFVDECHNYFSLKWKEYFESISKKIILASGTAANVKITYHDQFDEDNTYTDTLIDLIRRLKTDYEIELKIRLNRIDIQDLDGCDGINISNLQDYNEAKDGLKNPATADKFWEGVFKGYGTSPLCEEEIYNNPTHVPIYCETVAFAESGYNYLKKHPELGIKPIMCAGSKRDVKNESELNWEIEKANVDGLSTAMFTAGAYIQGISIKYWKNLMNISCKKTYEIFYQFLGRIFEIDVEEFYGETVNGTMYDYYPHRTVMVGAEFADSMSISNKTEYSESIRVYFRTFNIWDFVKKGDGTFVKADLNKMEKEIREYGNSSLFRKGCKVRLIANVKKDVMIGLMSESKELVQFLLDTAVKQNSTQRQALEAYMSDLEKGKNNYSEGDTPTQKLPKTVKTAVHKLIDAMSVYTERIPYVAKVLYKHGLITNLTTKELMLKVNHPLFHEGFCFPNDIIAEQFSSFITKFGVINKIDKKISDGFDIPVMSDYLDLPSDEFFEKCEQYDDLYRYDGVYTQLSVKHAYDILTKQLSKDKILPDKKYHIADSKSGAINIALARILYKGTELSKEEVLERITFSEENKFHFSSSIAMGFINGVPNKKDFIIINPPYKGGLHIDIFNKAFEELNDGGTLICLHPSTPFINRKPTKDDGKTQKIKEIVSKYKTRLTLVDGNKIFDAGFFTPLSITRVEKVLDEKIEVVYSHIDSTNKEVKVYDKLDDIFIHGNDIVIGIYNKILSKMNISVESKLYRNGSIDNFYLDIIRTCGNIPKNDGKLNPDFYCLIYKKDENNFEKLCIETPNEKSEQKGGTGFNQISINSKEEGENLLNYLLTKFARFCVSLYKMNIQLTSRELEILPYMDFSQEWTDKKLFEHFKLEPKEQEFINNYIQNWYEKDGKSN